MKKIIVLILSLAIVFAFSIPVLAATDLNALAPAVFIPDETENSVVGLFDYVSLTAEQQSIYKEFMDAISGKEYDTNYCYYIFNTSGGTTHSNLTFFKIPSQYKVNTAPTFDGRYSLVLDTLNVSYTFMEFSLRSREQGELYKFSGMWSTKTEAPYRALSRGVVLDFKSSKYIFLLASSPNSVSQILNTANFPNLYNNTFKGQLIFRDNNPEQPTPPLEPETPVEPPKPPIIPQGDPNFVPYDTSVWEQFLAYVSGNIGSATNIGLLIFAVIFGIRLVVLIVRRFTKRG